MNITVMALLVISAFLCTIASAISKSPLWIAVVLLCIIEALRILPKG